MRSLNKSTILFVLYTMLSAIFLCIPLLKYESLHTTYYDLGFYAFQFHNWTFHDGFLSGGHLNFYFPIVAFLYNLLPINYSTHFLLLLQSLLLLYSVLLTKKIYGSTIATLYFFSIPLWVLNTFDFHFEFLFIIFILCFFYFARNINYWKATLFAILAAMVKEPYSLTAVFCGVYLYMSACRVNDLDVSIRFKRASYTLIIISIIYFICAHIITHPANPLNDTDSSFICEGTFYARFCSLNIIFNSLNDLSSFFNPIKWLFFILPLSCFFFLPVVGYEALVIALPSLLIAFLSPNSLHSSFNSHYVSVFLPIFCEATYLARTKLREYSRFWKSFDRTFVFFPGLVFSAYIFYSLLTNYTWAFESHAFLPSDRDSHIKHALVKELSDIKDASIVVQNTINYYPIYNNKTVSPLKILTSDFDQSSYPDYFIYDLSRPLFIDDRSCVWRYGACTDYELAQKFTDFIKYIKKFYVVKYEYDNFYILMKSK